MFESLTVPSIAPCPVGRVLEQVDEESKDNLETALGLSFISNAAIAREIRLELDRAIDATTIANHRKGLCRCSAN